MGVTVRTPKIDEAIIHGISQGTPLAQICRELNIDRTIVYDWRKNDAEFDQRFARARDIGFDAIAEDILDIMDEAPERVVTMTGDDRSESRIDSASVQRAKNRAEMRLKLLAKWDPKRYGDRQLIGSDPENPLPEGFKVTLVKPSDA